MYNVFTAYKNTKASVVMFSLNKNVLRCYKLQKISTALTKVIYVELKRNFDLCDESDCELIDSEIDGASE